jgi:hypothetical protein
MFSPKLTSQYCSKDRLLTQKPELIFRAKYGKEVLEPYLSIAFL